MNDPKQFGKNLQELRKMRRLPLTEFSEELCIPRSTLQSVLKSGETTLDTACRISNTVHIPLTVLTDDLLSPERINTLHCWLSSLSWYCGLSGEKQETAYRGILLIWEAIQT